MRVFNPKFNQTIRCDYPGREVFLHTLSETTFNNSKANTSFWGFVITSAELSSAQHGSFVLKTGMYFLISGEFSLSAKSAVLFEVSNTITIFSLGGPIEEIGRLNYIDGCTDTLLISPIKLGMPCLNALYFPEATNQTMHTHDSFRAGVIFSGFGKCNLVDSSMDLKAVSAFYIPPFELHSFQTFRGSKMVVIAFHPETDFGPTDENHPMINKTFIKK